MENKDNKLMSNHKVDPKEFNHMKNVITNFTAIRQSLIKSLTNSYQQSNQLNYD